MFNNHKPMNTQPLNHHKSIKRPGLALAMFLLALLVPGVYAGLTLTLPANTCSFITDPYATPSETMDNLASPTFLQMGDSVLLFDCTAQWFETYTYLGGGPSGWLESDGVTIGGPPPNCPRPGRGFVYCTTSGVTETLYLTGTSGSGPSTLPCGDGTFSLVGPTGDTKSSYSYEDIVGPPVNGSMLAQWDQSQANFTYYTYICGAWYTHSPIGWTPSVVPAVLPGTSVLIKPLNASTALSGVVVSIAGPAYIRPGSTKTYVLTVINFGLDDFSDGTLTVSGIPGYVTLTPISSGEFPIVGGFEVENFSLDCGKLAQYTFSLTCAAGATIGANFPMTPNLSGATSLLPLTVTVVNSWDPNNKSGPTGVGPNHYLTGSPVLPYAITFENQPSAKAPAQRVVITDQLDPAKVDPYSFQFGAITFGNEVVTPPAGANLYSYTVLSYNVGGNIINVQIDAALDLNFFSPTYGKVTWTFQSLDPDTGKPPSNPLIGFLPPNTTPPEGQGMVTFTVNPLSSLVTGDLITNSASIVFDANAPIATGIWTNTIIKTTPALTIAKGAGQVTISWASWTLKEASSLNGPWTNSAVQVSPWTFTPSESAKFYRLQAP